MKASQVILDLPDHGPPQLLPSRAEPYPELVDTDMLIVRLAEQMCQEPEGLEAQSVLDDRLIRNGGEAPVDLATETAIGAGRSSSF
jgi:hypothetical protein